MRRRVKRVLKKQENINTLFGVILYQIKCKFSALLGAQLVSIGGLIGGFPTVDFGV